MTPGNRRSTVGLISCVLAAACGGSGDRGEEPLDPEDGGRAVVDARAGRPDGADEPSAACMDFPTVRRRGPLRLPRAALIAADSLFWLEPVGEDHPGYEPPMTLFRAPLDGQPDPSEVVAGLPYARHFQRAGGGFVWTTGTYSHAFRIQAVELDGAGLRELPSEAGGPIGALRASGELVYWAGWLDGTVGVVPLAGGAPSVLAGGVHWASDIEVDDTHVYLRDVEGVRRVPRAGGALALVTRPGDAWDIELLGDEIFWREEGTGVHAAPKGGGAPELRIPGRFDDLKIVGAWIYLAEPGDGAGAPARITRRTPTGGVVQVLWQAPDERVARLIEGDGCVYWWDPVAQALWQIAR